MIQPNVNVGELKAHLSYYINLAVKKDQPIIICNHNVPIAEIRALNQVKKSKIKFGTAGKNSIKLPKNFNKTSKSIIDSFYTDNLKF